jgi:carbonic anhydrase
VSRPASFCTAVNCVDGRVQLPVIEYLKKRLDVNYIDTVTEAGPNAILAAGADRSAVESIERRVRISVEHHRSVGIAVVGHHDCAGNPAGAERQREHTIAAVRYLRGQFPGVPVIGLWVNEAWEVSEISEISEI